MEITKTHRGFALSEFTDRYDAQCSIQKSSLAFEDCIWLGIDDPKPVILAVHAKELGIDTKGQDYGWVDYEIPENVNITTRMHLTQDMVRDLLPILQRFVDTGEIYE